VTENKNIYLDNVLLSTAKKEPIFCYLILHFKSFIFRIRRYYNSQIFSE